MTGHVTKDGDLAGPRALEHAVESCCRSMAMHVPGSGWSAAARTGSAPKVRARGSRWGPAVSRRSIPRPSWSPASRFPGPPSGCPCAGRRALAVEVQALVGSTEGPARRQATGLDARRFQLVAAVLDRSTGIQLGRAELFGASSGGIRVEDPACDLAVAAALASASTGGAPPKGRSSSGRSPSRARCAPWSACASGSPLPGPRDAPTCSRHPATKHPTVSRSCRSARLPRP